MPHSPHPAQPHGAPPEKQETVSPERFTPVFAVKPRALQPLQIHQLPVADNFRLLCTIETWLPPHNTGPRRRPSRPSRTRQLRRPRGTSSRTPTPLKIFVFPQDLLQIISFPAKNAHVSIARWVEFQYSEPSLAISGFKATRAAIYGDQAQSPFPHQAS